MKTMEFEKAIESAYAILSGFDEMKQIGVDGKKQTGIEPILTEYDLGMESTPDAVRQAKETARGENLYGHVMVIDTVYRGILGQRGGFGGENPGFIDGMDPDYL